MKINIQICPNVLRLFISLVPIVLASLTCDQSDDQVLAKIGDRRININEFKIRYKKIRTKMNLPDNGQVRSEVLRNMIDDALIITEAEKRGYDADPTGTLEMERIRIQETIDAYLNQKVFKGLVIQESDLKTLFIRLNTKVKARHLYADTRAKADSLYQRLVAGDTFEALAKEVFSDPELRDTGGSLGLFTVDEMDPEFEEAAFSLAIGQISEPVRTAQGYSIIQVQERITKPLLTEAEYAKHKSKLSGYWLYRLKKKAAGAFSDSVRSGLNIRFNQPVLDEYYTWLKNQQSANPAPGVEVINAEFPYGDQHIVNSNSGTWTIALLREKAKFTSEKQRRYIRNRENLEDFIAGLMVRDHILTESLKSGIGSSEDFEASAREKRDDYLFMRLQDSIFHDPVIPDDSLKTYFHNNPDTFIEPPRIHLREIVLDSEKSAGKITSLLSAGRSFEELARQYSLREWSAKDSGDIGIFTIPELGNYAGQIDQMEPGRWTGPVRIDEQYIFFKCVDKFRARHKTYEEAKSDIYTALKPVWQNRAKKTVLNELRARIQITTYPEKLKLIQMN